MNYVDPLWQRGVKVVQDALEGVWGLHFNEQMFSHLATCPILSNHHLLTNLESRYLGR